MAWIDIDDEEDELFITRQRLLYQAIDGEELKKIQNLVAKDSRLVNVALTWNSTTKGTPLQLAISRCRNRAIVDELLTLKAEVNHHWCPPSFHVCASLRATMIFP